MNKFVEKPKENAPSNLAIIGRYVLSPQIFDFLANQDIGAGREIQLTDAIQKLNEQEGVNALDFEGERYDVGEKIGFVFTTLAFALKDESIRGDVLKGIDQILSDLQAKENR